MLFIKSITIIEGLNSTFLRSSFVNYLECLGYDLIYGLGYMSGNLRSGFDNCNSYSEATF